MSATGKLRHLYEYDIVTWSERQIERNGGAKNGGKTETQ
jgi:hypothetical protein